MRIPDRFWKNASVALGIGAAFVWTISYINRHCPYNLIQTATFIMLIPGMLIGLFAPDAQTSLKGPDSSGPISIFVMFAVNISFYSGLSYVAVALIDSKKHGLAK